jgi:hypothetical protein
MRLAFKLLSASLLLGAGGVSVSAAPVGQMPQTPSLMQQAQYYWNGREYCWYDDGWQGPGWYWCGYAWRRGYGWGGAWGWNNWRFRDDGDRWERREFRREWRDDRDYDRRRERGWDRDRHGISDDWRGDMRRRDNDGGLELHVR